MIRKMFLSTILPSMIMFMVTSTVSSVDINGRTTHFVNVGNSPPGDMEEKTVGDIYTIQLHTTTTIYKRYYVPPSQFAIDVNWEQQQGDFDIYTCAVATYNTQGQMFYLHNTECWVSKVLFSRSLGESNLTCSKADHPKVFMNDRAIPSDSCDNGLIVFTDGDILFNTTLACGAHGAKICIDGELIDAILGENGEYELHVPKQVGDWCFFLSTEEGDHSTQQDLCSFHSGSECAVPTASDVVPYTNALKSFSSDVIDDFFLRLVVGLEYDGTNYVWSTGVSQPSGTANGWATGEPSGDQSLKPYGFVTENGLVNSELYSERVCCMAS